MKYSEWIKLPRPALLVYWQTRQAEAQAKKTSRPVTPDGTGKTETA